MSYLETRNYFIELKATVEIWQPYPSFTLNKYMAETLIAEGVTEGQAIMYSMFYIFKFFCLAPFLANLMTPFIPVAVEYLWGGFAVIVFVPELMKLTAKDITFCFALCFILWMGKLEADYGLSLSTKAFANQDLHNK